MSDKCAEPGHAEFWTVHVHGPDDLVHFDTEDGAEAYHAAIVDLTKPGAPFFPMTSLDPVITSHVIAPTGGSDD